VRLRGCWVTDPVRSAMAGLPWFVDRRGGWVVCAGR
jgi:hypothetical protein